jgi:hypothetical protein
MNTSAAQFDYIVAQFTVRIEVEFLRTVEAYIRRGHRSALEPVRADNVFSAEVFYDEVVAKDIELVHVVTTGVGSVKPLIQLQIENQKSQAECCHTIGLGRCQADAVRALPDFERPTGSAFLSDSLKQRLGADRSLKKNAAHGIPRPSSDSQPQGK